MWSWQVRYLHQHFAIIRKLNGISDQVIQDLTQPPYVTDNETRHVRIDTKSQFQFFEVRFDRKGSNRVTQTLANVEDPFFNFEFASFNFREVQHVIDHHQQSLARFLNHREVFSLVVVQLAVKHKLGHANDGVHRRSDFMAHVGEEITFGPICSISDFLCGEQFAFRFFASSDVVPNSHHTAHHATVIHQRHLGRQQPDHITGLSMMRLFAIQQWLARPHDDLVIRDVVTGHFGWREIVVVLSDNLVSSIQLQQSQQGFIGGHKSARAILDVDQIGNIINNRFEQIPLTPQLLLGLFLVGHISGNAEGANHLAFFILQGHFGRAAPFLAAVAECFMLNVSQNRLIGRHDPAFIRKSFAGMFQREKIRVRLPQCITRISQSKFGSTTFT